MLRLWGLAFALLVPVAIVANIVALGARSAAGLPVGPFLALTVAMDWSFWALLVPMIVWLARRYPLDEPRFRGVGRHIGLGAVVAAFELMLFTAGEWFLINPYLPTGVVIPESFVQNLWVNISSWYPYGLLVYWIIAIAAQAYETSRKSRATEIEAAQLEEELTRAQLVALRMQLHPHFLCNTLNTASVFMRDGRTDDALEVVVGLGDLLNRSLDSMDRPEVTLREELEFIDRYLGIERRRFSDRLETRISVDEELMGAVVPTMILQPLVENSIRHGLARRRGAGRLEISAEREGESLQITVEDDGPGFDDRAPRGRGVGLENPSRRLDRLYGALGRLELREAAGGGAAVGVRLPLRLATNGASS